MSIIQEWAGELGLRHQGCLMSTVRGCDVAPKEDVSKHLMRQLRGVFLNAHVGETAKAKTFMEAFEPVKCASLMERFRKSTDHYPIHYVMHLFHASQIVGNKHPDADVRMIFNKFYMALCHGFHVNHETEAEMDGRLNADEDTFARNANCSTVCELEAQKFAC